MCRFFLAPKVFEASAHGLFENLIMRVFRERRPRRLGHPFSSARMAQRAERGHNRSAPIGFVFQARPMASWVKALQSAVGFVFTKPSAPANWVPSAVLAKPLIWFVFPNSPLASRARALQSPVGFVFTKPSPPANWVRSAALAKPTIGFVPQRW